MASLGCSENPLQVAIVGSGPSGFYAAEALLKTDLCVDINILEKLPAPFGLVRYGVAPDHPKLKQVSIVFDKIARDPNVKFYGNVEVGKDVSLQALKDSHHAVLLCYGADTDRNLNLPGEQIPGSHTATEFVAWYNGHPQYRDLQFDLSQRTAVVIGQGNVAADVCRILAKPVDDLKHTDIASHALEQLAESRLQHIHVIGRRSPAQAKFTSKELIELGQLSNCTTWVSRDGFTINPQDQIELDDRRSVNAAKCVAHFAGFAATDSTLSVDSSASGRQLHFHFLLSPVKFHGTQRIERLTLVRNQLQGQAFSRTAVATNETIELDCGLCFRSIGYRGRPLDKAPFDPLHGVVPNTAGRVLDDKQQPVPQLYTSGWIKRGPSGIIGTNRADSVETINTLLDDLPALSILEARPTSFESLMANSAIEPINYQQWLLIDQAEVASGKTRGKPREKITEIDKMLAIAG